MLFRKIREEELLLGQRQLGFLMPASSGSGHSQESVTLKLRSQLPTAALEQHKGLRQPLGKHLTCKEQSTVMKPAQGMLGSGDRVPSELKAEVSGECLHVLTGTLFRNREPWRR